ncbi:MAG TPA: DUF4349 domain-containing protein, partial [Solirubrobacteraceae bacterium]
MSASEMTIETLRAHAPRAPEALRLRVLELEPRRMSPRRRLVLVVVPVAAAIAVGAALVHGFLGSSSPKPVAQQTLRAAAEPAHGAGATGKAKLTPIPSVAGAPARLQHTEATLEIRVKDASAAATRATRIATSLGGYAESVQYSSTSRSSFVVLRVPAQEVKTAVARLAGLGTLVSQDLSVQDLQHDFDVETAQIAELRRTVAALQTALRNPSLPDAQRVLLQIRLANAKRSLAERLNARKGTVTAGTTARISLQLRTKSAVVPAPRPQGRLGRMLHSAVGFLGLEGTVALYAL